jgi:serine/threonine protein kinase
MAQKHWHVGLRMVGKVINKYRIEAKLGEGGMGIVYKAWDTVLERTVALKMLHPTLAQDEKFLKRFRAEARALARLENPNIVAVFDLQETEFGLFIVMQYVEGATLAEKLQGTGPLPLEIALPIIKQLLTALNHAHQVGVIHRDIKPGNVMLTPQGLVKITDFGMAKIHAGISLTQSTSTGGTLFYMPPEQMQSLANVDQRSDIYSTGMTFYEMLAGRLPFEKHENIYTLPKIIVEGRFLPPDQYHPAVPKGLSNIVMKAIAKSPAKRYQSAEEMLEAITQFEAARAPTRTLQLPKPRRVMKVGHLVIAFLSFLVLASLFFVFSSSDLPQRILNLFEKPTFAALSISTNPDGATVFLDRDSIGVTSINAYSIKAGTFSLRLKKQGYITLDTTVVIAASQNAAFSFSLKPITATVTSVMPPETEIITTTQEPEVIASRLGSVQLFSQPSEANIFINSQPRGKTPRTIQNLEPGDYTLSLKKAGYQDYSISVTVAAGKEEKVDATLRPLMGNLRVVVKPSGSIYLDGALQRANAPDPFDTNLPIGPHRVKMESPGLGFLEKTVYIEADKLQEVSIDFNKTVTLTIIASDTSGRGLHAEIFVAGQLHGQTPKTLALRVGQHEISVGRKGYVLAGEARVITLEEDVKEPIEFILRKMP